MSHKDVWNTVVHSREIFEWDHPLHNLDVMVLGVFLFMCVILWVTALEWDFCRKCREGRYEYTRWLRQWRKQQKG